MNMDTISEAIKAKAAEIGINPDKVVVSAVPHDEDTIIEPNEDGECAEDGTDDETGTTEVNEAQETADDSGDFKPKSPYERAIAKYLAENASKPLLAKIKSAKKAGYGIKECFGYITAQARKQATANCAMVEDAVVFGWAVHYFEDEWQSLEKKKITDKAKCEADKAKREAEQKAKAEAEAARIAAMTPEERELAERAEAERVSSEAQAKEEAERIRKEKYGKAKAERKECAKLKKGAYERTLEGEEVEVDAITNAAFKTAAKDGIKDAKADIIDRKRKEREAKAEARAKAESAQMDLFA